MVFRGVECGLCPFWGVLRAYRFVWVVQYPVCTWIRLFNRLSLVQGGRFWSQKKLFCRTCSSLRFCKKIEYGITSYSLGIIQRNQTNWHAKNPNGKKPQPRPRKNHGREPPHPAPPSTPSYDPPPAETATTGTTGAANATEGGGTSAAPTPGRAAAEAGCTAAPPPPA